MSRIGLKPLILPAGVKVEQQNGKLTVIGPKGQISLILPPQVKVSLEGLVVKLSRTGDNRQLRAQHGTTRALIANLIQGVTEGFSKNLQLVGTGYRAKKEGEKLVLNVGFSHPITIEPLSGLQFEVIGNDEIVISGLDKAKVNQTAINLRRLKPPDAYKGKGIRFKDEKIKLKPGKAAKVGVESAGGKGTA